MKDEAPKRNAAYWSRRLERLKNSVKKRVTKIKQIGQKRPLPLVSLPNDGHRRYAEAVFAASERKPTLKNGYIARRQRRLESRHLAVKAIAFYLPQYHPIAENDDWWGKGFTEWTNVTRAVPQFVGHHQPRLPGDLGFYDLRVPEVMRQQVQMAKDYGLAGFCFHHYWFGGRRLLERPVQQFLADPTLDIGFCLCWANENWSRRWDGSEHEVLMEQHHSPEDDLAFIDELLPAFRDTRYIRIDGRPVLIVYRATLLPDMAATARRWRDRVREKGLPGLYLVSVLSFDIGSPHAFGFDAAVEFPPHQTAAVAVTAAHEIINPNFSGQLYDYRELAARFGKIDPPEYLRFKTVMPSWDNCARRLGAASSFVYDSPEAYASWLDDALEVTLKRRPEERLLFVNAWNEWGEGTYLEPDRRSGYANLNATANVLARSYLDPEADALVAAVNARFNKTSPVAIVLHLFHQEMLETLANRYFARPMGADFIVTVSNQVTPEELREIERRLPNVFFVVTENRGRDIQPFLRALEWLNHFGYEFACKLHTKKSPHRPDGEFWRDQLFEMLLGVGDAVPQVSARFAADPSIGLLVPAKSIHDLSVRELHSGNVRWLDELLVRLQARHQVGRYAFEFSAGSMFWFRTDALRPLADLRLEARAFEFELGQLDGTLAHAVERLFMLAAGQAGFSVQEVDLVNPSAAATVERPAIPQIDRG